VGESFSLIIRIFQEVMGLDVGGFADGLVDGLNGIADWININRGKIYEFFTGIRDTIRDKVIPFLTKTLPDALGKFVGWFIENGPAINAFFEGLLRNAQRVAEWIGSNVVKAFDVISAWVSANGPLIDEFFTTLGKIVSTLLYDLTNVDIEGGGIQAFLQGIGSFMQFIIDHAQAITDFIEYMVRLRVIFELLAIGIGVVVGIISALVAVIGLLIVGGILALIEMGGLLLEWIGQMITGFQEWQAGIQAWREQAIASVTEFFLALGAGFVEFQAGIQAWREEAIANLTMFFEDGIARFEEFKTTVGAKLTEMVNKVRETVASMVAAFKSGAWFKAGVDMIQGVINGIGSMVSALIKAAENAVKGAVKAVQDALKIKSPSQVFIDIGESTMEGMAVGIRHMTGLAQKSMETAIGEVVLPAIAVQQYAQAPSSVNTQNSYTNNYNLTINSQARKESLVQDYNMLKSLAGG
jgi:hypothetical protein